MTPIEVHVVAGADHALRTRVRDGRRTVEAEAARIGAARLVHRRLGPGG